MSLDQDLEIIVERIFEKLNYGHKENIYQLALCHELEGIGYKVQREVVTDILYDYYVLGSIRADIIIDDKYIIEMECLFKIGEQEIKQLQRYLDLFNIKQGSLININYRDHEIT